MSDEKIIINTQGGPVINGGTFTNVEFVANKYVVEKVMNSTPIYEEVEEMPSNEGADMVILPEILCTPEAESLLTKLQCAGIVDKYWYPIGLSNAEKGTLVEYIAEKLNIRNKWKLFGNIWRMDSETLRTSKARGLEQDKTWKFRNQLNTL